VRTVTTTPGTSPAQATDGTAHGHRPASVYEQLVRLYADYTHTLTDGDIARWPEFFTEDCVYEVTSAENVENGWPLPVLLCEGRLMVEDRAYAFPNIQVSRPRRIRYLVSGIRVTGHDGDTVTAGADLVVVQALRGELPRVVLCGEYRDEVRLRDAERPLFRKKVCVYDHDVIDTAFVLPV
jgi:3-phenylpropionate/cinnamic acid dioxygenase small subunit